tara:strand:- start:448 stop:759 length:312 start_codon:yes stop_codon:yes gene_type:complete
MYIHFDSDMRENIVTAATEWFSDNIAKEAQLRGENKSYEDALKTLDDSEAVMEKVAEEMSDWFENDIESMLSDYWGRHKKSFECFFIEKFYDAKRQEEEDRHE